MGADHGKQEDYNIILISTSSRIIHTVIFFHSLYCQECGVQEWKNFSIYLINRDFNHMQTPKTEKRIAAVVTQGLVFLC